MNDIVEPSRLDPQLWDIVARPNYMDENLIPDCREFYMFVPEPTYYWTELHPEKIFFCTIKRAERALLGETGEESSKRQWERFGLYRRYFKSFGIETTVDMRTGRVFDV